VSVPVSTGKGEVMEGAITDVEGIRVGQVSDFEGLTGCTVILCGQGAVGGVDVRGSASGTRELDALRPLHLVEKVHGLLLAGGSAFGLEAAAGVMEYLEEQGIGFDVGVTKVPIVPAAILFDLAIGDPRRRPDRTMGYQAALSASSGPVEEGSVGAGTGATVGKLFGMRYAMKGGIGTASVRLTGGLIVGALVVVNAFGDVLDPSTGRILAGVRDPKDGRRLPGTVSLIKAGVRRNRFGGESTTLAVVATNAILTKVEATKVAQMGHDGLARTIAPVHTTLDGDVVFALATGRVPGEVNAVGSAAAEAVAEAVVRAIKKAKGLGGIPAYNDLFGV